MLPVSFPGAQEIKKPENMTDEQCISIPALTGVTPEGFPYFLTAWKPSFEDLKALNDGEVVFVQTICNQLPPMALFTVDKSGTPN